MQYIEITGNGTYKLKQGPGYLQGVTVNLPGSGTIQIADNTSAAAPFIAGGGAAFALPSAGSFLDYDCHFSNGLTIVIASMVTGSITVEWF